VLTNGGHPVSAKSTAMNQNPNTSKTGTGVYTCVVGTNADLIAAAARIYLKQGDHVLDTTFGKGCYWKHIDLTQIYLVTNDLEAPADFHFDFRQMDIADATFNISVLDPPYLHDGKTVMVRHQYNNHIHTGSLNHEGIIRMYEAGVRECCRVTKPEGYIWIKCQDEIQSGQQNWSLQQIELVGNKLGLHKEDVFVLYNGSPHIQHHPQLHARRNHSYLIIFKKSNKRNKAEQFTDTLILEAAAEIQRRATA